MFPKNIREDSSFQHTMGFESDRPQQPQKLDEIIKEDVMAEGSVPDNAALDNKPQADTVKKEVAKDEAEKPFRSKKEAIRRELSDDQEREEWYRQAWDNLRRLEKISLNLEHSHIADYVALMGKPRKMVILNFMGGLARGFGFGIGFTLLVAVLLYILKFLVGLDLPYIGDFIAQLVQYVEDARTIRP